MRILALLLAAAAAATARAMAPPMTPYQPHYGFAGMGMPSNTMMFPVGAQPQDQMGAVGAVRGNGVAHPAGNFHYLPMMGPPQPNPALFMGGNGGYVSPLGGWPFGGSPMANMRPAPGTGRGAGPAVSPFGGQSTFMQNGGWPQHGGGGFGGGSPMGGGVFGGFPPAMGATAPGAPAASAQIAAVFQTADEDGDGKLSEAEFKKMFGAASSGPAVGPDAPDASKDNDATKLRFAARTRGRTVPALDAVEVPETPAVARLHRRVADAEKSVRELEARLSLTTGIMAPAE
jgi:hypothetical protein